MKYGGRGFPWPKVVLCRSSASQQTQKRQGKAKLCAAGWSSRRPSSFDFFISLSTLASYRTLHYLLHIYLSSPSSTQNSLLLCYAVVRLLQHNTKPPDPPSTSTSPPTTHSSKKDLKKSFRLESPIFSARPVRPVRPPLHPEVYNSVLYIALYSK